MNRNIPEFIPTSPTSGDVIRSAHIKNIENYLIQLLEINGSTGNVSINFGSGLAVSGNSISGVTIYTTGSVEPTSAGSLSFPAVESNFYPNLVARYGFTSDYNLTAVYVTCDNAPSGNILIDVYKNNDVLLSGAILGTGGVLDEEITGAIIMTKGDKIKFEVTSVSDLTAGNAIYFGYY